MSYDLHLFLPVPGEDPKVTARRMCGLDDGFDDEDELPSDNLGEPEQLHPLDELDALDVPAELARPERVLPKPVEPPEGWQAWRRRLADALVAADPRLTVCEPEHVEVYGPEGMGITISLFDGEAGVHIAYWHEGSEATAVMDTVWGYLQVLRREGGLQIYDSQMEQVLDLAKDRRQALASYGQSSSMVVSYFGRRAKGRPWWKFW